MKILNATDDKKQEAMLEHLQNGTVMAFIDSRKESVIVPEHLKNDPQLRLNFDYDFNITDFRVLPDRIEASLSFSGNRFFCTIPFESLYLLMNHATQTGTIFPQSTPVEFLSQMFQSLDEKSIQHNNTGSIKTPHESTKKKTKNSKVSLAKNNSDESKTQPRLSVLPNQKEKEQTSSNKSDQKKSHLRIVK